MHCDFFTIPQQDVMDHSTRTHKVQSVTCVIYKLLHCTCQETSGLCLPSGYS